MKIVACALALSLMSAGCAGSKEAPCTPHGLTSVGETIPDCTFDTLTGTTLRLPRDVIGTPTVLNFWASWCIECTKEMPAFQRIATRAGARLKVIGMNTVGVEGETRLAAEAFVRKIGVTYPIAFDEKGRYYFHFNPRPALPETVFVDARGIVAERHIGALTEDEIAATLARVLKFTI